MMKLFLADTLMVLHLAWVAFMILGLPFGIITRSIILRWFHCIGMLLTTAVALMSSYCPLTILEETLRWDVKSGAVYKGHFLASQLSSLLYPNMEPWIIRVATIAWGVLTFLLMVFVPPGQGLGLNGIRRFTHRRRP